MLAISWTVMSWERIRPLNLCLSRSYKSLSRCRTIPSRSHRTKLRNPNKTMKFTTVLRLWFALTDIPIWSSKTRMEESLASSTRWAASLRRLVRRSATSGSISPTWATRPSCSALSISPLPLKSLKKTTRIWYKAKKPFTNKTGREFRPKWNSSIKITSLESCSNIPWGTTWKRQIESCLPIHILSTYRISSTLFRRSSESVWHTRMSTSRKSRLLRASKEDQCTK